ncbi:MAG: methylated-DNA--[protein]-cysteine S-methyltransferase [Opitutales bacterium]
MMRVAEFKTENSDNLGDFRNTLRVGKERSLETASGQRALMITQLDSPLGAVLVASDEEAVYLVEFGDRNMLDKQFQTLGKRLGAVFYPGETGPSRKLRTELTEYFAGKRTSFETPVAHPGTSHQELVWRNLSAVPYGTTTSYGELAARTGGASGARAVARAVGANRLAIVLPCHRVVGADGKLTGYSGGLRRKRYLLNLEQSR